MKYVIFAPNQQVGRYVAKANRFTPTDTFIVTPGGEARDQTLGLHVEECSFLFAGNFDDIEPAVDLFRTFLYRNVR